MRNFNNGSAPEYIPLGEPYDERYSSQTHKPVHPTILNMGLQKQLEAQQRLIESLVATQTLKPQPMERRRGRTRSRSRSPERRRRRRTRSRSRSPERRRRRRRTRSRSRSPKRRRGRRTLSDDEWYRANHIAFLTHLDKNKTRQFVLKQLKTFCDPVRVFIDHVSNTKTKWGYIVFRSDQDLVAAFGKSMKTLPFSVRSIRTKLIPASLMQKLREYMYQYR